ncbi:MAG: hypothetical protein QXT02_06540 [Candidatus Hadarchaeum sp.]
MVRSNTPYSNGQKLGPSFSIEYLGGHPQYMKRERGTLKVLTDKIIFLSGHFGKKEKFSIPLKDIKRVELQLEHKVTLGRMLLLGIFAFGAKKEKKYVVIDFNVAGMEAKAVFDFPGDIGDRKKQKLVQTILEAKKLLVTK